MAVRFPLAIVISAVDAATPTLGKVESRIGKFARSGQALGRGLSMTATPAIAALGVATFRVGADFEQSLLKIRAASGATVEEIAFLRSEAKKMTSVGYSANEAAAGMVSFARAGLNARDTMKVLTPSVQLATAANADAAQVSDDLINIMAGYKMPFEQTTRVVDGLTWATDATTNSLDDLTQAFRMGGPPAAAAGEKFEDTLGILAMMGQAGFRGTLGGTAIRGFTTDLARLAMTGGSAVQAAILRRHGMTGRDFQDSQGGIVKMIDAIELLEDKGLSAGEIMLLFGERAGPGLLGVLNQGLPALRELIRNFGEQGVGSAAKKAELMLSGPEGALRKLVAEVKNLAVAISESGFIQFATDGIRTLTRWTKTLSEASPAALNFGTKVALAAALVGPAVYTFSTGLLAVNSAIGLLKAGGFVAWIGTATTAMWGAATAAWAWTAAMLANPVTWVAVGVAALVAGIVWLIFYFEELWLAIRVAWNSLFGFFQNIAKFIFNTFEFLNNALPEWLVDLYTGNTLKFDLEAEFKERDERLFRELREKDQAAQGHVVVDFKNVPRGATVEALAASGAFELQTGYAMGGF